MTRSVLRADGMPVPFSLSDAVHAAIFSVDSRDEREARHLYCSLTWTDQMFDDALTALHAWGATVPLLKELLKYTINASRRVYALGVWHYDCLAFWQSTPTLAEAISHADTVPRDSLRGNGPRLFLSRGTRAEKHASANVRAAERGIS